MGGAPAGPAPSAGGGSGRGVPSEKLFCGGLPLIANEEWVMTTFAPYGQVVDCKVLADNGRGNKAALVRMATIDQASLVIAKLNNSTLPNTGQQLVVRFSDNPSTGGGPTRAPMMMMQAPVMTMPAMTMQPPAGGGYGRMHEGQPLPASSSPYGSGVPL